MDAPYDNGAWRERRRAVPSTTTLPRTAGWRCPGSFWCSGALGELVTLLHLLHHPIALERRQVVDEEHATQMVALMLDAMSEQPFRLEFIGFALAIQRLEVDLQGTSTSA